MATPFAHAAAAVALGCEHPICKILVPALFETLRCLSSCWLLRPSTDDAADKTLPDVATCSSVARLGATGTTPVMTLASTSTEAEAVNCAGWRAAIAQLPATQATVAMIIQRRYLRRKLMSGQPIWISARYDHVTAYLPPA